MPEIVRAYRNRFPTGPKGVAYENLVFKNSMASPTTTLWDDCPYLADPNDPGYATHLDTEFINVTPSGNAIGGFTTTVATSGTVTMDAVSGLAISAGAATAGQGINLQMTRTPWYIATNRPVWMEAQVKFTGLTSLKIQFFVGLAEASTALITSNALADKNLLGFSGVVTDGTLSSVTQTAAASVTTGTGVVIANSTTYRLGLKATTSGVDYWVNNAKVATLATNIPASSVALAPAIVVQANASVTPVVYLQFLKVFGLN